MNIDVLIKSLSRAIFFENWLRFYFISEEGEKLFLRLPEKAQLRVRTEYKQYAPLMEDLMDSEIDHQTSLNAVCLFVAAHLEGFSADTQATARVLDSSAFQLEVQLFNLWLQAHEEQLDRDVLGFNDWLEMFDAWKRSESVQSYLARLKGAELSQSRPDSGTVQ